MGKFSILFSIMLVSEIILAFVFSAIAQIWYKKNGIDWRSVIKGVLERTFLMVALINSQTSALTFFSALKLATRLKHSETTDNKENKRELDNKFNDYYLIGNLLSVCVAIGYTHLYTEFDKIELFARLLGK
ncbi:hypothetical protein FW774_18415 [Pedobacter sp. BS3]|uniref:hypothetical protein n=1 Tax=Pedobacter sp. BS3 TaxID=2567937 RepID=UPI0011EEEBAD|nr:hypothetical protein [Pedobacter sp. BS3]TZF81525.1 hypothetical protein FW774_18415 [Pedobacter sp. BS3]